MVDFTSILELHLGKKGSGNTFVRAVQQILYPIRDITASFVDDIAVHSDEFDQHLRDF